MAKNRDTQVISVISGKGGTGKSLFTAVLGNCLSKENCRVLLVDMDIHVRGLTILLSKYMGTSDERMSISDSLLPPYPYKSSSENREFAVFRFQECEFIPAVLDIAQPLSGGYDQELFADFFNKLARYVSGEYDIVLLDCRSGLDDAVVFAAEHSNFIVSVSEDDDVCLQANTNLVNYLRYKKSINNIYTVINKGRRIKDKGDIEEKINNIFDISCIGAIPFDERIMEDYGKDRFWLSVYDTLYFYGIVRFWKRFQERTQLPFKIDEEKYNFVEKDGVGIMTVPTYKRAMRIYGFIAIIIGALLPIVTSWAGIFGLTEFPISFELISTLFVIIGLAMIFLSSRRFRLFLLGKDDYPERLKK